MATFATTKQSVLDRINTLASSSSTTAEESIYLAKALRDAAQDITFVWRGPWQATYAYVVGDVAQYDGNAYYCINAHTAGTSFSSGSGSWQTMVVGGTKFWSGSSAPTGAEDGDLFLDTDDEKLYHQVSGSWSLVVDLGGNIWTSGTTVPANSSGEDGDFFLKTDDEKLYQRESGAWTFKVDLGGSRWTSSAAAPSNSNGEQGDVHFDTATQKIYEKGASAWSELADLTPLQADWNGTGLAAILNKPTFKTIGGSNIVGSGDIAVVPADGSITDAKISGMSSSKLSGALPAIDGSALQNVVGLVTAVDMGTWTGQPTLNSTTWTDTGLTIVLATSPTTSQKVICEWHGTWGLGNWNAVLLRWVRTVDGTAQTGHQAYYMDGKSSTTQYQYDAQACACKGIFTGSTGNTYKLQWKTNWVVSGGTCYLNRHKQNSSPSNTSVYKITTLN